MKTSSQPTRLPSAAHAGTGAERRVAGFLGLALTGIAIVLMRAEAAPESLTLLLLMALMVLAEHRDRLFDDETSMSGSIVVAMASVVALHETSPLLGPMVCGAAAGFYWPHLRTHAWAKVVINAATIAFSSLGAALVFGWIAEPALSVEFMIACLGATVAYWCINSLLLGGATASLGRAPFVRTTVELLRSETQMLVFAVAGAMCGLLFLEVGVWAGALALVLVLVAVDLLVISRPRPSSTRAVHRGLATAVTRVVAAGVAGVAALGLGWMLHPVVGVVIGAVLGTVVLTATAAIALRHRTGSWDLQLAFGLGLADLPYVGITAIAGGVGAATSVGIGVAIALAGTAAMAAGLSWRRRAIEQTRRLDDTEILAMLELVRAERRQPLHG